MGLEEGYELRTCILFLLVVVSPSWAIEQYACFESTRDYTAPNAPKPESLVIDGDSVTWVGYPDTQEWTRTELQVANAPCTLTRSEFLGPFQKAETYCWKEQTKEMHFVYAVFDRFTRGPNQGHYKCLQIK